jgi:hypothetical protein
MRAASWPVCQTKETIVYRTQDIGTVRVERVHRALAAERDRQPAAHSAAAGHGDLRELLDEAHARIRFLEQAIRRLTATL